MGYHDRCFEDIPYLESKDKYHNNRRDRLTEKAIERYAKTNPEYRKVLNKYYRPDKKLPRIYQTASKNITVKTNKLSSMESHPVCNDSQCSSVSESSERLCPNCRQKFHISKKKVTKKTTFKEQKNDDDSSLTYWKTHIDDEYVPSFPPRFPNECTSLILPAMFTDEERRYYQSKQPKYPPVEKITSIMDSNVRPKPTGNYNIITGEELYEY